MSDSFMVCSLGGRGFDEIIFGHRGPSSLPMDSAAPRQNTIGAQDEAPLNVDPAGLVIRRVRVGVTRHYLVFCFRLFGSAFGTDISLFPLSKKPSKATDLVCLRSHFG